MIIGIGCDIVELNSARELNWDSDTNFLNRVFTKKEIKSFQETKKINYLTGRFAVKEAVLKCLGTGMFDGISLRDIEVQNLESGQPRIDLRGEVGNISNQMGIHKWQVSISHSKSYSIAFVVAEN